MLVRQTRASEVAKIWDAFMAAYPNAYALAAARESELVRQLAVLGFGNQKAEALCAAASYLIEHHGGEVPKTLEELLAIPHIGNYAARAVLCFAFGVRIEIVDTNVLRFYARYFGESVKPDIRRNPHVWEWARHALPRERQKAQQHNYGILDFTADICKPGRPRCEVCPLAVSCHWGQQQLAGTV